MKRFFISGAVLFLAAVSAYGQQIHLGVTTGINSTFVLDEGLKKDPRYHSDMSIASSPVGLSLGIDLTPGFGLSLESIMANQELVYQIVDVADQVKGGQEISLQYIHLPLMLNFLNGSNAATRFNFSAGPQLSILREAVETYSAEAGEYKIPENMSFADIQAQYPGATQTSAQEEEHTYTLSEDIDETDLLTRKSDDFKKSEFQIAAAMGLTIDLGKHLMLSTLFRANYRVSDMTNEDAISAIMENNGAQIFAEKSQVTLGLQLGLHYSIGVTRSHQGE